MEKNLDISTTLSNVDLFQLFKQQLIRDFDLVGLQLLNDKNIQANYEHLLVKLTHIVEDISTKNHSKLMELLYRIDISELQLKKELKTHAEKSMEAVIADLIIKRELQKVVLKQLYK